MNTTDRTSAQATTQDVAVKPQCMTVKPLVWDGLISGAYRIEIEEGGIANLWYYSAAMVEDEEPTLMRGAYLTLVSLDELKAAAQADHETRVLGEITLRPEAEVRAEAVREVAGWYRREGWMLDEDEVPDAIIATAAGERVSSAAEVRVWRPMSEAPAGDVSAVIDIWDGERRITDCFWSETDECWLFEDWDGAHYINVAVSDPKAWMPTPAAPEGL